MGKEEKAMHWLSVRKEEMGDGYDFGNEKY